MGKTKRESGVELLRIIIMFQIIILHLYEYGNLASFVNSRGGFTDIFFDGLWSLCRMPVDVFMLITGYFLISSKYDLQKVFGRGKKVYLTMLFYSLILAALYFAVTPEIITVPKIFKAFMPFFSKEWYFLSIYLIILFLSPFLNIMLQRLDKKQYLIFTGIVFVVMSLWSTLAYVDGLNEVFSINKIVDPYMGKSLGGLLLLYLIGGYLRRFTEGHDKPQFKYLALFLILCATDFALYKFVPQYGGKVFGMFNNPLVIGETITIFLFFRDLHFYSPAINTIAGTTLGIYAIHENPYMRELIWKTNFSDKGVFMNLSAPKSYIAAFAYCIAIFVVCCLIDLLRQRLFDGIESLCKKRKSKKAKDMQ